MVVTFKKKKMKVIFFGCSLTCKTTNFELVNAVESVTDVKSAGGKSNTLNPVKIPYFQNFQVVRVKVHQEL
jgi:hypothetical protein